jgi:hypothetical protein
MTQDEIIEMWHKAWPDNGAFVRASAKDLEAFAKLVVQHERDRIISANELVIEHVNEHIKQLHYAVQAEREACAKVCDDIKAKYKLPEDAAEKVAVEWCAEAIRARGSNEQ